MEWFGYARTVFHHSSTSLIATQDGSARTFISFPDLCKSVTQRCALNPFLFNGHMQTIWTNAMRNDSPIYYKRKIFIAGGEGDNGSFAVDFVVDGNVDEGDPALPKRTTLLTDIELDKLTSTDRRPMLVVLHGVSGGSHESFIREMIATLIAQNGKDERNWEACVVNS
ncbi:hypothetical protein V502_02691 [Pseudogymnoascus sp. VKM F-4520 (FW-2644)]|nr:hypothetical protein V502_02691 [Pseudogymnoascus sp. VKM F-4520 (FW-2644)]